MEHHVPHVMPQTGKIGQIHAQHHLFFTNESNCNTTIYSQITVIATSHVISATRYEPWNDSGWTRVRPGTAAATKQQHVEKHVYLTTDGGFVCQMEPTYPPSLESTWQIPSRPMLLPERLYLSIRLQCPSLMESRRRRWG